MQAFQDYKTLLLHEIGSADTDYAALQTLPATLVVLEPPTPRLADEPLLLKVEIVLEWLDDRGDLVTTGRGSYDVQLIRVTRRRSPLTGEVIVDTPSLTGQIAHRPVVVTEVAMGDRISVRLTNLVPPDGTVVQARVLYREIL
jgi:hypothetical protein